MLKLFGRIEIDGTKAGVDRCALVAKIPNGKIRQIGLKAKIPAPDSWVYASPWYRFNLDSIDVEISDFLTVHLQVGEALAVRDSEVTYAFLTLVPVVSSHENTFGAIFSYTTMELLVGMKLSLQISPEATMPNAPYWKLRSKAKVSK